MLTLKQFEAEKEREICAEYNITPAHYRELFEDRKADWLAYLEECASKGEVFPKDVCRSIADNTGDLAYWQKFFRCVPADVLLRNGMNA